MCYDLKMTDTIITIIALSTWLTPMPQHAYGRIVYYGPDYMAQANADYRGYDLSDMRDECGLSVISPSDLGKLVWVKLPSGLWYGPCLAVDVAARGDFDNIVYVNHEVAEVTFTLAELLGVHYGASQWGTVWIGQCPPRYPSSAPLEYQPPRLYDNIPSPLFWPYPTQMKVIDCGLPKLRW